MDEREEFQAIVAEGQLLARTAMQASLVAVDRVALSNFTAVVMKRTSWRHLCGFLKKVHIMVEDLPFERSKLFAERMEESLHTLKDSRATLYSLGVYTPVQKRRLSKYQTAQRSQPTHFPSPQRH